MNKELYALLKEYKSKELDNDFINKSFELMMKERKELIPYIKKMEIKKMPDNYLGSYSDEERIIRVDKEKMIEEETTVKNKKILAMQILRHELEHAKQLRNLYQGKDDIESAIIRYSLKEYAIRNGLVRPWEYEARELNMMSMKKRENYAIDPGERLAEINAWKFIVNLIKNQKYTEDLLTARSMLYYSYSRGYEDNEYYLDPPTYEYLLNLGLYHDYYLLKKRVKKKDYSYETRLTYGLPLTYEEYEKDILKKVKLRKRKKTEQIL